MSIAPQPPTRQISPNSDLPATLPEPIRQRLAAEGVHTLGDWQRLSRKQRASIWGVTARTRDAIDEALAEALR